jgi:hypothetical protein
MTPLGRFNFPRTPVRLRGNDAHGACHSSIFFPAVFYVLPLKSPSPSLYKSCCFANVAL